MAILGQLKFPAGVYLQIQAFLSVILIKRISPLYILLQKLQQLFCLFQSGLYLNFVSFHIDIAILTIFAVFGTVFEAVFQIPHRYIGRDSQAGNTLSIQDIGQGLRFPFIAGSKLFPERLYLGILTIRIGNNCAAYRPGIGFVRKAGRASAYHKGIEGTAFGLSGTYQIFLNFLYGGDIAGIFKSHTVPVAITLLYVSSDHNSMGVCSTDQSKLS